MNWLKFAMLYIKELKPIIPDRGRHYLSQNFKSLLTDTDLIKPYTPRNTEGQKASWRAVEEFEKMMSNPKKYVSFFGLDGSLDSWRNSQRQVHEIFEEKYSALLVSYCLENKIGVRSLNGIKVPEEVAFIFMTILANEIAESKNVSAITDIKKYNSISLTLTSKSTTEEEKLFLAKNSINLKLPNALEEIPLKEFIKLRQDKSFHEKLTAFHNTLDLYLENTTDDVISTSDYLDSLNYSIKEISKEITLLGLSTVSVGLGIWSTLNTQNIETMEVIKEVSSISGLIGGGAAVKSASNKTENKRLSKRFLSDLKKIKE